MDLLPLFQWCYNTPVGEAIRNSNWMFAIIEAFHLLGLGFLGGTVLMVDLRLLGVGLRKQPAAQLWAATQPWLVGSVVLLFASGIPLFLSEAIKCLYSFAFWVKMTSLLLVLLFTFTILRRVVQSDFASDRPLLRRSTAIISLVLWFGVAWGGRWIGFS
ncbi:MAG TPA: DUF6644 family protein [Xanthobacteraceae bacterium]|jgi:hypothetical protein|nr:DUF6644 family protein [Xanthobacteraceae bacterium]